MALRDLAQRLKDYLTPQTGGLATQLQGIRQKTVNTPLAKNLQSTFYGQGYQAPVQKQLPSLNYFSDLQTGRLSSGIKPLDVAGQTVGAFGQQRVIEPIKQIPQNIQTIKTEAPKIFNRNLPSSERWGAAGNVGLSGLMTAGALIPFGPEDFAMAGYDVLKAKKAGKDVRKAFTGEEYTGLGESVAKGTPYEQILNVAEIPLVIAAGGVASKSQAARNARRIFIDNNPKLINEALQLTRKAEMINKPTYRSFKGKPGLTPSEIETIDNVSKQVIPQVVNNREMKNLYTTDKAQYYRTLNTFIQEQVVDAFHPELRIGLQASPTRKIEDFPELKAKGLTPEVNPLKYKTTLNIQNKDDIEQLRRIFSDDVVNDIKNGKTTNWRGTSYEDLGKVNIINEAYSKPKLKIEPYEGTKTFYHGTSPDNVQSITQKGFMKGSDLPEGSFRSGGYGQIQNSVSFSSDAKMASRFTGQGSRGAVIESQLKPNAKVVTVKGIEDAVELNDYADELLKQKIDAVWIGGGEKELIVLNPKSISPVKSTQFNVIDGYKPKSGLTPGVTYKRGDVKNLENQLDEVLGTESFMFNKKWTSKFPARQTGLAQLEEGAKAGDPDAIKGLKQAEDLIAKLEQARTTSRQPTISQPKASEVKPKFQVDPSGKIISEPYFAEPKQGKIKIKNAQIEKTRANQDYKDWQKQVFQQEGLLTKEQLLKKQLSGIEKQVKQTTLPGGVKTDDMRDISGFKSYTRDVYRNFKEVYGSKFENIKRTLLDPFDQAKGNLSRSYSKWADRVNKEVEIDLGIKKGSKESAAVQQFGEGKIQPSELISQFGRNKAEKIVKADQWFRKEYDQLLDEVNGVMARIYPNNPEKIIPKRKDYYRHFKEMGQGITGLLNIFDSPSNISSSLAGTSEFVKPRSKWLSFAQKRLGKETDIDAVGGFLDYVKAAEYNKNIDPFTNQFRRLAEDLAIQTENNPRLNNFIEYLHDFSNDLAGKTNPADRFVQKIIPGGRKTMSVVNWLNNRVKANVILGNLSSSVAQIFNVPQGIADVGIGNSTKGLGLSVANIFGETTPIKKSNFITERYGGGVFDRFDRSMVDNAKKGAAWITGVLDEVGTKYIWNSQYAKALADNIPNPIKFADDRTRALVAGRGIGEVPLIQKSRIFQLVAPFQLEVGNLWHVMGDWVGEKQFGKLATFFIASHIFNKGAEAIRGSDVIFDPIQASVDAYNTYSEEEDKKMGLLKAGGRITGEVLSNIPVAQNLAAAYPEYGFKAGDVQFPTRTEFFGEGDPTRFGSGLLLTKGLQDPLYKILLPFGGQQLKRTIGGQQATERGYSKSATGRVRFPTEDNPLRNIQRAIFGEYSTPAAREYFKEDRSVLGEKQSEQFKTLMRQDPDKAQEYYQNILEKRGIEKQKETLKKKLESEGKSLVPQVYAAEEIPKGLSQDTIDVEKLKFELSDEPAKQIRDGVYLLRTEAGNPSLIDISKEIPEPKYTGVENIDKKLKSAYKGDLTRRGNNIIKLYEAGQINLEQATALMDEIELKYDSTKTAKKPKKITVKSTKVKMPGLSKAVRRKAPTVKISTIKLAKPKKPKSIKITSKTTKPKKIKLSKSRLYVR